MKKGWRKAAVLLLIVCFALSSASCASKGTSPDGTGDTNAAGGSLTTDTSQQAGPVRQLDCNPLTGAQKPEGYVDGQRPVAVMLDNQKDALPQSGLAKAVLVYEMVTEGGIPRLMAVFNSTADLDRVGPVRSTRDQFVQLVLPSNMILLHIGTSIYATDMLRRYEYPTVDGIYLGVVAFSFDTVRAQTKSNEHCFFTSPDLAAAGIAHENIQTVGTVEKVFNFVPYDEEVRIPDGGNANAVSFSFSQYANVSLVYSGEIGAYLKSEYGDAQMDEYHGVQLLYKNVFLLGSTVSLKADGLCTDFDFSSGSGYYFYGGCYEPVTWSKGEATAPLKIFNAQGQELQVNVGNSYVALVDNNALQQTMVITDAADNPVPTDAG